VSRIRVMLADDEESVLDVMSDLMASDPSLQLVGTARDARQAIDLARAEGPDVALLDVRMPAGGGAVAARGIRRGSPQTKIVAFAAEANPDAVVAMLDAGAIGYVGKTEPADQLLRAVHRSMEGRASISVSSADETAEALVERFSHRAHLKANPNTEKIAGTIDGPSLRMVYQPIVELTRGRVVGLEALARFDTTPRRPPEAWFAEAAKAGLLTELELAAMARALSELDRIPRGVFLSVNLSPATLASEDLPGLIAGVAASRIVVELTEGSAVRDYETLMEQLRPLREHGMRLAIDDVGAGFSSLGHLVRLEPEYMKLDRTIVAGLAADPVRRSLIERLVSFSDEVGISVIAEGIETDRDLEALRTLYVPYGQGFHLGRPGPIPEGQDDSPIRWPGRHAFHRNAAR
jgi:EAL domain-containing protein (putative c-di-GMP-specific phosphodiesterase class I)/CheY-like chemotaxis protein